MKIRESFRKDDTNYTAYEDNKQIKVYSSKAGLVDRTEIKTVVFDSITDYKNYKEIIGAEKLHFVGAFKKVNA